YMTLSHRWGENHDAQMELTLENMASLQQGVETTSLSSTYRDAITTTRRLGVGFLWIDSLCIIQNEKRDWQLQSAAMGMIYRNSFLNISSAVDALDCGMFVVRDPSRVEVFPVRNSEFQHSNTPSLALMPWDLWSRNVNLALLNKRGWVLQERILSPRVLHFTEE
ncbi:heterokaryon incompatibility, partial [Setomelanomma holmii]